MATKIRAFEMGDYREVRELWEKSGLEIRPGDSEDDVRKKTARDPELFLVAEDGGRIVGSVMGAWDGRRGWLYHLGVLPSHQRQGLATELVREAERRMKAKGVVKANAHVLKSNKRSIAFFEKMGYGVDESLLFYGKYLVASETGTGRKR